MKTTLIIYLLFMKALMGISGRTLETTASIQNNTSSQIKCINFYNAYLLDDEDVNTGKPILVNLNGYSESVVEDKIVQGEKSKFLCKLTVEPLKSFAYGTVMVTSSIAKREDCIMENQNKIQDTICLDSSCKNLSLCCNNDLCNTLDNFTLTKLAYYYRNKNKVVDNNYLKYTNTSCQLDKRAEIEWGNLAYKYCIVANNKEIYNYNKNISQLAIADKDSYQTKIVLDSFEDSDDTENSKGDLIASDKTKIDLPKKLVIRLKMWLKFLSKDSDFLHDLKDVAS